MQGKAPSNRFLLLTGSSYVLLLLMIFYSVNFLLSKNLPLGTLHITEKGNFPLNIIPSLPHSITWLGKSEAAGESCVTCANEGPV